MTNRQKIKDDTITGHNIIEDNIATMVNNGDVAYEVSPCVVMNNLVKNHNQFADEMGNTLMSSSAIINKNAQGFFASGISNLNTNLRDEVKEFNPPVDYETAFSEYYPEKEKTKDSKSSKKKS